MSMIKEDAVFMKTQNEMRTAHFDDAHVGDIQGAWGTIRATDTTRRKTWYARLLTLLIIMGPGLVTMVGDNDAGGVATYTQAGQNYGTSLLWTLLILIPVLIVNQEMVVRLGAVTRVGHARLIFERFGKFWGAFSVIDLFILNFLTIVTEFIGFSMALNYFGVSPVISVPVGVIGLIAITVTGSFRRWESANASIIGVCAVSLSTAYAFGDVFKANHSLHRKVNEAKFFYSSYAALIVLAGAIVLIPNAPLGLLTFAVQALAGILLPSATVFLVLLCNDRTVLGPWVNRPWLNVVAAIIVGLLVILSLILAATTLFPDLDAIRMSVILGIVLLVALLAMGVVSLVQRIRKGPDQELVALYKIDRTTWQMPPLQELTRPTWPITRKVGMFTLRVYLLVAIILMVYKVVLLAFVH